jgi:hypothetical protein
MAWIYGIVCGWDDDMLPELADKFGWSDEAVARLKRLRALWVTFSGLSASATRIAALPSQVVDDLSYPVVEKGGVSHVAVRFPDGRFEPVPPSAA